MNQDKDHEMIEEELVSKKENDAPTPFLKDVLEKLASMDLTKLATEASDTFNMIQAKAFIAPLMRKQHYALRGKLLAQSFGVDVSLSEEELKEAEELGFIKPIELK